MSKSFKYLNLSMSLIQLERLQLYGGQISSSERLKQE